MLRKECRYTAMTGMPGYKFAIDCIRTMTVQDVVPVQMFVLVITDMRQSQMAELRGSDGMSRSYFDYGLYCSGQSQKLLRNSKKDTVKGSQFKISRCLSSQALVQDVVRHLTLN